MEYLFEILESSEIEEGTKLSALHTVGRLSKKDAFKDRVAQWAKAYIDSEKNEVLLRWARRVLEAIEHGRPFSVIFENDTGVLERSSIIPRAAGAPPKLGKQ